MVGRVLLGLGLWTAQNWIQIFTDWIQILEYRTTERCLVYLDSTSKKDLLLSVYVDKQRSSVGLLHPFRCEHRICHLCDSWLRLEIRFVDGSLYICVP